MKRAPLSDLIRPVKQGLPNVTDTGSFRYIDISSIDAETKEIKNCSILPANEAPSRARQHIQRDDILLSTVRPNLNAVAQVSTAFDGAIGSTGFCVLRAKSEVLHPRYLFYFCQTKPFVQHLTKIAAGASYPAVTDSQVLEMEIALPTIAEQESIVRALDFSNRLRALRRFAVEQNKKLVESMFLEMFGEPWTNPKGYSVSKLSELGTLDRGRSRNRPRNAPELYGGPYPFVQTGDISKADGGYIRQYQQTYSELGLAQSKMWPAGTLCITIAANIGKTAILSFPACFPDSVVGFTAGKETKIEFIQSWLLLTQKELERKAPESAQKNINLEILSDLVVPLPPRTEQDKFAHTVGRIVSMQEYNAEAMRQIEGLFQSLLDRSFNKFAANFLDELVHA